MNEDVFKDILAKAVDHEFAEFNNVPEHKFSLKHRIAMNRIFARYERNVRKLRESKAVSVPSAYEHKPRRSLKQRILIATVIVILMTFLAGWVVVFVSEKFHGTVYRDNTRLIAVDTENCPQTIEYRYALASVPDGFEFVETNSSPIHVYTQYKNELTGQGITLYQWVKSEYSSNLNTENYDLKEVDIGGKTGLYIDFSTGSYDHSFIVWDNGDYIIEIMADLDKEFLIKLSNLHKVENNQIVCYLN